MQHIFLYEHVRGIKSLDIVLKEKKKVIKDLLYFNEFSNYKRGCFLTGGKSYCIRTKFDN